MIQLIKYLIFGKQCAHKWELLQKMEPWNNDCRYLYTCQNCGKMKKVKLKIRNYG